MLLVAACAEQNTPIPDISDDGSGADSSSGGSDTSGGKTSNGGSVATAGSVMMSKAGTTSTAGKTSMGGSGNAGGDDGVGGTQNGAGTAGKAGSGSKGGSGGTGGTGGKGGSGGTGGKGGSGGTSGSGGSAGSGCKASPSGPIGGISARYEPQIAGVTGASIGSKLIIANIGPNTVDLGTLKLRYYLTNEVTASVQPTINWAFYRPNAGGSQMDRTVTMSLNLFRKCWLTSSHRRMLSE